MQLNSQDYRLGIVCRCYGWYGVGLRLSITCPMEIENIYNITLAAVHIANRTASNPTVSLALALAHRCPGNYRPAAPGRLARCRGALVRQHRPPAWEVRRWTFSWIGCREAVQGEETDEWGVFEEVRTPIDVGIEDVESAWNIRKGTRTHFSR